MDKSICKTCKKGFNYYSSASKGIYCSYSCCWADKKGKSFAIPFKKGHKPWNKDIKIDKKKFPNMGHNIPHTEATKAKIRKAKSCEPKGDKHWNWKGGWKATRNRYLFGGNKFKVLERDNHTCQSYNSKKDLIIHHIDGNNHLSNIPNHSMSNLITLCNKCHCKVHNPAKKR